MLLSFEPVTSDDQTSLPNQSTLSETFMAADMHPTDTGPRTEKGWLPYGLVVALLVLVGVVLWSRNGVAVFGEVMTAFVALCF